MGNYIEVRTENEDYGMQFIEKMEPPLKSGRILINAQQDVKITKPDGSVTNDGFAASKEFYVRSRAFTIDPADVYSVSPGKNASGNYANELPHITFRNKTLPWEYETSAKEPWLALLVLTDKEYEEKDIMISELMKNQEKEIYFPVSAQPGNYLEKDSDLCHVIDMEKKLFQEIAPQKGERTLLSHGKFLDLLQKSDETIKMDGYFSTIIGNRFIPSVVSDTIKSAVHLVSMFGYDEPDKLSTKCSKIRLVSLYHWNVFSKSDELAGFKALMEGIDSDVLKIDVDNELLQHGYVPKRHLFRSGESTVSLYRGPLAPFPVPERRGSVPDANVPATADGALVFNKDTALFDASYSTAWQTGRLLTVQNKAVASAIVKWRKSIETECRKLFTVEFLNTKENGNYSPGVFAQKAVEAFLDILGSDKQSQEDVR